MKVSIIVPVYNVEKYIKDCVESIIKQQYKEFELILIDDGSTDNSGNICDKYATADKRITVIHQKNQGLSGARNSGIITSKGEYISFIDSDDYIDNNFLMSLVKCVETTKCDIAVTSFYEVYDTVFFEQNIHHAIEEYNQLEAIKDLFRNNKLYNFAWNKLYKRELFDEIRFPKNRLMEDLGTTYKLFQKANNIAYFDDKLYYYRQHVDSILHNKSNKLYIDKFELSAERYIGLADKYGEFKENDEFMIDVICECNNYIKNIEGDNEIKNQILQRIIETNCISIKKKVKLFLFLKHNQLFNKIYKYE